MCVCVRVCVCNILSKIFLKYHFNYSKATYLYYFDNLQQQCSGNVILPIAYITSLFYLKHPNI